MRATRAKDNNESKKTIKSMITRAKDNAKSNEQQQDRNNNDKSTQK